MQREGKEVLYLVTNTFIVRKQAGAIDTFHINVSGLFSYFNGKENNNKVLLVDKLVIEQDLLDRKEKFIFSKTYASDILMKQDSILKALQP